MSKNPTGSLHIPVLTKEAVKHLKAGQGGQFLDCTLGGGGHTLAILQANPSNKVVASDRDLEAVQRAEKLLETYAGRLELKHAAFSGLAALVSGASFDGLLADLGASADQIRSKRGFSFSSAAPLDMRMDRSQALSAAQIVNDYSERELYRVLKEGGVGREARAVARAIVRARPLNDTLQLSQVVAQAARGLSTKMQINPATVTFQAIRMAVNSELDEIKALLLCAPALCHSGARLAVICFHSLEDKLVAGTMRHWQAGQDAPAWWPGGKPEQKLKRSLGRVLTRRAVLPGDKEVRLNPAARSARLRVFEFI